MSFKQYKGMDKAIYTVIWLIFLVSSSAFAGDKTSVEWAPFVKKMDVTEAQLKEAADKVQAVFLGAQQGFIKRELVKRNDSEYADIVYWETIEDAQAAGERVNDCKACVDYFLLMDQVLSESAGAGFSYYEVIHSWD